MSIEIKTTGKQENFKGQALLTPKTLGHQNLWPMGTGMQGEKHIKDGSIIITTFSVKSSAPLMIVVSSCVRSPPLPA